MLAHMMAGRRANHVSLRDYQIEYVDGVSSEWAEGRDKVLVTAPTGAGKTTLMGAIISKEVDNGGKVLVVTDRKKLTKQFAHRTEEDFGIPCGIEMSSSSHGGEDVVCCTVQTITNRINQGKFHPEQFTLLAFDEAHLSLAAGFQSVAKHFDKARIVGLTATPRRGDKKDLLKFYDSMVEKRTLSQLIAEGHLAPLTIRNIPISIRLETQGKGDFDDDEINHAIEPYLESCADAMVSEGRERCCLSFLPLIVTSKKFTDMLNDRGMKTEHVDGTMDESQIESAIKRLEMGKTQCLSCSQILGVGVDIKPVSLICNLRPTRSWTMFVQFCGRGTRTHDPIKDGPKGTTWPLKRDCILLDPLWLTTDHNLLMRPSVLVADNDDDQKEIDKALKKNGGGGLMEAKSNATEEREARLKERLTAMQKRKERTVDAMEFFTRMHMPHMADWEPMSRHDMNPVTDRQRETLEKNGFAMESVKGLGHASAIIDVLSKERWKKDMATMKQVKFCIGLGAEEEAAWRFSFKEASEFINLNYKKPSYRR